jgi:EpsI family protein
MRSEVYAGYSKSQGHKKRLASPRLHYAGGDRSWSYVTTRRVEIPLAGECQGQLEVTETVLQHAMGSKHAVLYWYQRGQRAFPDEFGFRLALIRANLTRMPTDSVVIRIATPVSEGSKEQVFLEQRDLARGIYCEVAKS